jgi:hypothetical protein
VGCILVSLGCIGPYMGTAFTLSGVQRLEEPFMTRTPDQSDALNHLISCAFWIDVHLRRHPRLEKWLLPKVCRQEFHKAIDNYRRAFPEKLSPVEPIRAVRS